MNTYYTTRDFEFLRNRPVVLLDDLKAEIDKLQAKLERAALNESADVSREIEDGNKIVSLETALAAANERIAELQNRYEERQEQVLRYDAAVEILRRENEQLKSSMEGQKR